jgi:CPA1 family monovalent cation:H+ antiporter
VFGALISATDPISVIAVFRQLGASRRLTLLVDAEALFNDGVAVVLFTVLLAAATGTHVTLWSGVWLFSANAAGGIAIGAAIGFIASRVTHHVDDHLLEITLTTIVAWGSYLAADALHVSGVLAVITGGLVVGSYGMAFSMTPTTKLAVTAFWEYAAFAVNSVVFLIVGIEEARTGLLFRSLPFALCAALVVLGGRLTVYPIAWVCNRLGSGIGRGEQHVLFWGGLRGALSMALALGLERSFPARDAVLTATFGAVLFSLLAQGLTIGPLLRRLGLVRADNAEEARKERAYLAALQLATRAGLKELDRLDSADEFPNWALDAMRAEYAARAEALTAAHVDLAARSARGGADLAVAAPVSALEHTREIRRRLLSAERIALNAVAHEDPIDAESLRALIGRIDAQLLAHAADR